MGFIATLKYDMHNAFHLKQAANNAKQRIIANAVTSVSNLIIQFGNS